jgi:hypothetical protein
LELFARNGCAAAAGEPSQPPRAVTDKLASFGPARFSLRYEKQATMASTKSGPKSVWESMSTNAPGAENEGSDLERNHFPNPLLGNDGRL